MSDEIIQSPYINQEISWLEFNKRVMQEAFDEKNPLLERVHFLSIFASNLDEFYMVKIPVVHKRVLEAGMSTQSGNEAYKEMRLLYSKLGRELDTMEECWSRILLPELEKNNIYIRNFAQLEEYQKEYLNHYFSRMIFPQLTPLAFDSSHPFPYITNQSVNLAVILNDIYDGELFVRVKIPDNLNRLVLIPKKEEMRYMRDLETGIYVRNMSDAYEFVWIEDIILENLDHVFPGQTIKEAHAFRITRDGDVDIDEDGDFNLLKSIEKKSGINYFGSPVRIEINKGMSDKVLKILLENLKLHATQVEALSSPVGLVSVREIFELDIPHLKYPPFTPLKKAYLSKTKKSKSIFEKIMKKDVLIYRPYDSFESVVDFVQAASVDPDVISIKITLYRVDRNSKIIEYLKNAADNGKQVVVLIELKARFDEENNVSKAKELEHGNVHVVYGVHNLKTHAKLCMVMRREKDRIVPYVHMSTGNYNASTAKVYTDFEYFTADPEIGQDALDVFNGLTGYSRKNKYKKLLVAPRCMRSQLISKIRREAENHIKNGKGHIIFKMNSLVDIECIDELYKASQAGVKIDLQVRGMCSLRPGVPGLSDNIKLTSIVGRFLEHTRAYYFYNDGNEEMYLGSADIMKRNLDRRVEILFPVNPEYRAKIKEKILAVHLKDNVKARIGLPDGTYELPMIKEDDTPLDSQAWMTTHQDTWE